MVGTQPLDIADERFTIQHLLPKHTQSLQCLFERCADFIELVDGQAVSPDAARELFQSVPPGRSSSEKILLGILDEGGGLVGVLDGMPCYPDETTWWIGLLMLAPEARSRGLGRKVTNAFCEYAARNGATSIMLGVVEENQRAFHFWEQQGFALVRATEPQQFGKKMQAVSVMRRVIA